MILHSIEFEHYTWNQPTGQPNTRGSHGVDMSPKAMSILSSNQH